MTRVDAAAIGAASDVTSQRKPVHVDGQRRDGSSLERRLGLSSRLVTFAKEAEHLVAEGLRILEQESVTESG